jgi:hypothetical protein
MSRDLNFVGFVLPLLLQLISAQNSFAAPAPKREKASVFDYLSGSVKAKEDNSGGY